MYQGGLDSNVDKNHSRSQMNFHTVFNVTYTLFGPLLNLHPSRRLLSVESSVPPQREADRPAGVLEHRDGLVLPRAASFDHAFAFFEWLFYCCELAAPLPLRCLDELF